MVTLERDCEDLMKNSSSLIFCIDKDGRITDWSFAMQQLTGIDKAAAFHHLDVGDVFGTNGMLRVLSLQPGTEAMKRLSSALTYVIGVPSQGSDSPRPLWRTSTATSSRRAWAWRVVASRSM